MTTRSNDAARVLMLDGPRGMPRALALAEACALAGRDMPPAGLDGRSAQRLGRALRSRGIAAVVVLGAASGTDGSPLHWLDAAHGRGWVTPAPGADLAPEAFAAAWAANLAEGHVPADAALLAWDPLPRLDWGDGPTAETGAAAAASTAAALGLYAIVDSADAVRRVLDAGVRTVQLRAKRPHDADAAWDAGLRAALRDGIAAAAAHGALLVVNDHWRLAAELAREAGAFIDGRVGASGGRVAVHLGQEDVIALGDVGRAALRASGLALGLSSHAVWELCRARALAPAYVACGPVWPTTTKDMPWRPQGLDNLAWWCRVAGAPVVAIGGILTPEQVRQTAACGAAGVCVLRGLGDDPRRTVPALQQAFDEGHREALSRASQPVERLHPTLEKTT